jgi:hypothetical protein
MSFFGIYDIKKKMILLVKEFHADNEGIGKGCLPYLRKEE